VINHPSESLSDSPLLALGLLDFEAFVGPGAVTRFLLPYTNGKIMDPV
jgi:hypothetical protein